ncbi:MAG TPA: glycine cleavage T C-terminal barrel domain-containing protein [Candidatus Acidoferrum sp.]|nr:glycine cleavage T C-terminal barrel domain-containing protein [Candidatus Acidoferrum sp.]
MAAGALTTALSELHRKHGAEMGVWFGCEMPDSFGDWEKEHRYFRESAALVDKNYRAYLEFTGPDRGRYLNALLTGDIKGLMENQGVISLFLNPQGHIQAEIETYMYGEALLCVTFAMIREKLIPALDKYIIMDDVTLTDRTEELATLGVEGPKTAELVRQVSGVELGEMQELESRVANAGGVECRVTKRSVGGLTSAEFLFARGKAEEVWSFLKEAVERVGGGAAGFKALNAVRLESGVPWFGYDFGEKQIPHEAGLQESHISYTKGCYTGQEIVERVRSRGQVNRARVSLQFEGAPPATGAVLTADGKEMGFVTRTGYSPTVKAWIGMGYVRREMSAAGSRLELPGSTATVMATPIS